MKRMKFFAVASFLMFAVLGNVVAQEEKGHLELKNEGNEALRGNDFKKALQSFEASIAKWPAEETLDAGMVFNAATCARREKDNEKALQYYTKSQELAYKADMSAYYRASALKELGREPEMLELLLKSIQEFSTSSTVGHMKKMLVTYYLKEGSESYNRASQTLATATNADPSQYAEITAKANEAFLEAKPWFEKALELDAANENALAALKTINEQLAAKK
jgi:tetratricopeptide (TPR) repeat protein